jgi:heme/copper-type cytochrome/quinol oxidase subunit 2
MITLGAFMQFWGVVFFVTTIFVWAFKREAPESGDHEEMSVADAYSQMWQVNSLSLSLSRLNFGSISLLFPPS